MMTTGACSTFTPLYVLRGHRASVQCLALCTHTPLLYTGDAEGVLHVWDLNQRRAVHIQQLHDSNAGIIQAHVLQQHNLLLTQGRDGVLLTWQLGEDGLPHPAPLGVLNTGTFSFCKCAVLLPPGLGSTPSGVAAPTETAPDIASLLLGDESLDECDRAVQDASQQQPRNTNSSDHPYGSSTQQAAGSQHDAGPTWLAMSGNESGTIGLWQLSGAGVASSGSSPHTSLDQERTPTGPKRGMAMAVQLLPQPAGQSSSPLVVVGYESGSVALWDARHPAAPVAEARLHEEAVMALALDPKRGRGMSGAADSHLVLFEFDSAAGALTFALQLPLPAAGVAEACMRWDGKAAATAGWDGKVRLWSLGKRPCLTAVGRHHSKQGTCLLYDAAHQVLISGGQDCHVAVWPTSPQQAGPD